MEAVMFAMKLLEESGPNTELGWLLFVVLGFFLLMVIVGWWASSRQSQAVEVVPETHVSPTEHTAVDDLVRLEGIGPKVAKVLNEAGITSFATLAAASSADIQKILSRAGYQMMNADGWIEQAKLAAQGDWTALEKLQGELKGGRKK
jgi:large subunit ribosomal protein L17